MRVLAHLGNCSFILQTALSPEMLHRNLSKRFTATKRGANMRMLGRVGKV